MHTRPVAPYSQDLWWELRGYSVHAFCMANCNWGSCQTHPGCGVLSLWRWLWREFGWGRELGALASAWGETCCLQGFHSGVAALGTLWWEQGDSSITHVSTPLSWSSLHEPRARLPPSLAAATSLMHWDGVCTPARARQA